MGTKLSELAGVLSIGRAAADYAAAGESSLSDRIRAVRMMQYNRRPMGPNMKVKIKP